MACKICKREKLISENLGICKSCIADEWDRAKRIAQKVHEESRRKFGLQPKIPTKGILCGVCANDCKIPENEFGFCGLVKNENGKLVRLAGTPEKGLLEYYFDPHPTNCVAAWRCAACGMGYPKYSRSKGVEHDHYNLSVFYGACSFNCLFCQNWTFKELTKKLSPLRSAEEVANAINEKVSCVCFFGGDPAPQILHAIEVARIAREKSGNRILRFCLETNGSENPNLLKRFADHAFESGGVIKFDLKFFDEKLNIAVCGVSNKQTYKNLEMLIDFYKERKEVTFLHAATLLVPGYVDAEEVHAIAKFIASLDETIPYSLLAFYPCFVMNDLPATSWKQAKECHEAAKRAGLKNVRIGNIHLLR